MAGTVLVTGVSRHLGARVARGLALHHDIRRVIGLDTVAPAEDLGRAEFVRADLRSHAVARVMSQAEVDTVVHLALSTRTAHGGARAAQKEGNVIGAMQLFSACRQTDSVRRIVLKSTCSVYGSSAADPALFREDQVAVRGRAEGAVRDALDVEGYLRQAGRARREISTMTLRPAHIVGPHVSSLLLDYLAMPVVPVPLGFDARLQLLHEDDFVAAMLAAVTGPATGVVNVAAPGILTLTQAVTLGGRTFLPVPSHSGLTVGRLVRLGGHASLTAADVAYLRFGRVLDTTRAGEVLGLTPRHSTREAFLDAVSGFPPPVPGVAVARRRLGGLSDGLLRTVQGSRGGGMP